MNIVVLTIGSAGDVHPFVGLALALRQRGHQVRFITNPYFGTAAVRAGLDVVPLGTADEFRDALSNPDVWHKRRGHKAVFDLVLGGLRRTYDAVVAEVAAAEGPTVVVASSLGWGARIAQDRLGFPMATVHLSPSLFRSSIAPPTLPGLFMPRWLPLRVKRSIWAGGDKYVLDRMLAPAINGLRVEVGLPPASSILGTWWNSPDRVIGLFPEWFAPPQSDWPEQARLTGFPRYDEADTCDVDPDLETFLAAGPPPVAFTPGTAMQHGSAFFAASIDACRRLDRRGLLLTQHTGHLPPALPPTVRHVPYAPFSRLLPRCAAIVHHGGIGTTAQALAAGIPQVITPFAHDQFDNADRVRRLGVGRSVRASRYTARSATRALAAVLDDAAVAGACRTVAQRLVGDDSMDRTCELVERLGPQYG
jgi:rhamnosyltransferase subunit B